MKLTLNIVHRLPGRDDGEYHLTTKIEDANGAGIVVEEIYTNGFDTVEKVYTSDNEFTTKPHTVKPEDIVYVIVLPTHD